jgi:hypothetical protein
MGMEKSKRRNMTTEILSREVVEQEVKTLIGEANALVIGGPRRKPNKSYYPLRNQGTRPTKPTRV